MVSSVQDELGDDGEHRDWVAAVERGLIAFGGDGAEGGGGDARAAERELDEEDRGDEDLGG